MPRYKFKNDRQAAARFATHDTAPYMDDLKEVPEKIQVRRTRPARKPVGLHLRSDYLQAIKQSPFHTCPGSLNARASSRVSCVEKPNPHRADIHPTL
jgi:hypothetical protein